MHCYLCRPIELHYTVCRLSNMDRMQRTCLHNKITFQKGNVWQKGTYRRYLY